MAAFLNDAVLDNGLQYITDNGGALHICSQQPTTYAEATSTYTLGNKTLVVGAPTNGASGRKVVVPAITDGSVTANPNGTASHWALVKTTATTALLAAQALSASQLVTLNNTFTLDAIDITIPDPA